jgi:hypothetical protein
VVRGQHERCKPNDGVRQRNSTDVMKEKHTDQEAEQRCSISVKTSDVKEKDYYPAQVMLASNSTC